MSAETRRLFQELARRIHDYRVPAQEIVPAFAPPPHAAAPGPAAHSGAAGRGLTIAAALHRQKSGTLTARDLVRGCLDTIARLDDKLNAFVTVTADEALRAAETLDAERRAGRPLRPLHG